VVTCQFEKITKGQNQLPWVYIRKTMGVSSLVYYVDVCVLIDIVLSLSH